VRSLHEPIMVPTGTPRPSIANRPIAPSRRLAALSTLSSPSGSSSPFRPTAQVPFPTEASSDLCTLSSVLLLAVPGLHASDFALLPSSDYGIRAGMQGSEGSKVESLYLPLSHAGVAGHAAQDMASSFVSQCGAVVESEGTANFWGGVAGKSIKVEVVEGLDEWELVGEHARSMRRSIMENLGRFLSSLVVFVNRADDS
jgi:hypothetical protein